MKILLVYPETPTTFWTFKNALKFISKKSSEPPLGLITVAAMLPREWELKFIDTNVTRLRDADIVWADYVFLSGMSIHFDSFKEITKHCKALGAKMVAGGPMCTLNPELFPEIDHLILNEAELTLPPFLKDLDEGHPQRIYSSTEFPDIQSTPIPRWDLLDMKRYASMDLQYSRGCPFNCEFCSITLLNGHKPRTKGKDQLLQELDTLYELGWRGSLFFVDDNFIGNKTKLKNEILPALIEWNRQRKQPFSFMTEVSINLSDDDELIDLMVQAGFDAAFVGIETPNEESLMECGKHQNQKRDLLNSVKKLQRKGLVVSGGFIVGFDNDTTSIFHQQLEFIQQSGIVTAMVGLLNAQSGTRLFSRLKKENRILEGFSGDNMDGTMNFIPRMNPMRLYKGYKDLLHKIYSPKEYYERVKTFLNEYTLSEHTYTRLTWREIMAFLRSIWILGLREKGKRYYWRLFFYSLFRYPEKFALAITMAIYGFHFRKVAETI
ncbi:B12-binding domain-containing radical SAM protein [candidate division KSB1 bacterium]|nr:B12-binding domain-containing radical SAM protein [candidate division KSB1 bacterium]